MTATKKLILYGWYPERYELGNINDRNAITGGTPEPEEVMRQAQVLESILNSFVPSAVATLVRSGDVKRIVTTSLYWDCDCEANYIHPLGTRCRVCDATQEDHPDSRVEEVEAMLEAQLIKVRGKR